MIPATDRDGRRCTVRAATCADLVHVSARTPTWRAHAVGDYGTCGVPAASVTLPTPAGRPPAAGLPYCDAHGGTDRSLSEAERSWDYVAPASVGGGEAVQEAGCRTLASEHAYVVVREQPAAAHPDHHWIAIALAARDRVEAGRGRNRRLHALLPDRSSRWESRDADAVDEVECRLHDLGIEPAEITRGTRPGGVQGGLRFRAYLGLGSHATEVVRGATAEEVERAAVAVWRERVAAEVAAIREARGGTLAWGLPVVPRDAPVVLRPEPGASGWPA